MEKLFSFALDALRIIRGNRLNTAGYLLIAGGLASIIGITSYVLNAGFVFLGIRYTIPEVPIWLSLTLILLGAGLLVFNRVWPEVRRHVLPHDTALLAEYRDLITRDQVRFFGEHHFRQPFRRDIFNPLETICDTWTTAHFEFENAEMQKALTEVRDRGRKLLDLIGVKTFMDDNNPALQTPLTYPDIQYGVTPATQQAIANMNSASRALQAAMNSFERTARQQIG